MKRYAVFFLFFFPLLLLLPAFSASAQAQEISLLKADTLFKAKKYAEMLTFLQSLSQTINSEKFKNTPLYFQWRNKLGAVYLNLKEKSDTTDFLLHETDSFIKISLGENHEEYIANAANLGYLFLKKQNFKESEKYFQHAAQLVEKIFGTNSLQYALAAENLGQLYLKMRKFPESEHFRLLSYRLRKELLGESHQDYIYAAYQMALHFHTLGKAADAKKYFEEIFEIQKRSKGEKNEETIKAGINLSTVLYLTSDYAAAIEHSIKMRNICKNFYGEEHLEYANAINALGLAYQAVGENDEAEKIYLKIKQIREKKLGNKHPEYAGILENLAIFYRYTENFQAAEPLILQAIDIRKQTTGENDVRFANSLNSLAGYYCEIGKFAEAEPLYLQITALRKQTVGENHPLFAGSLTNYANLLWESKKYVESQKIHQEATAVYQKTVGENHLEYANSLYNWASVEQELGNYRQAEELMKKALAIRKELVGEKNALYAHSLLGLSFVFKETKRFEEAKIYVEQALRIREEIFGKEHRSYMLALSARAKLNFVLGEKADALRDMQKYKNWALQKISSVFPCLSESEKDNYFQSRIREPLRAYNSWSFLHAKGNTDELYDLQLSTKAVLLQASQKMKNRILLSKDSLLIAQYYRWLSLKQNIIKVEEMPLKERSDKAINLDSLKNEAEKSEKFLSLKSENFASVNEKKQLSWKDVQKKLKKGEAAVEIVRFNTYGVQKIFRDTAAVAFAPNFPEYRHYDFTDSVMYAALIVKKNSKAPELVLLKEGNFLEKKMANYNKNSIFYRLKDTMSYVHFWQPIAEKLVKIQKVYFSPDGVYNQIALDALWNPETQKYLFEETEIQLLTNTRDLLSAKKTKDKTLTASLFGYPIYDISPQKKDSTSNVSHERQSMFSQKFQKISLLPGTKEEINSIAETLQKQHFQLFVMTGENAKEEALKETVNPTVLHVATHGFFDSKNYKSNPMTRSGLLLTGVSSLAREGYSPQKDDGVLTAQEAANLELSKTELVVLSACETALGDVRAGEGVYGLQRAFKVAGAKNLIMSLWKVDDAVTQFLMTNFYRFYVENGNVREAFYQARKIVKEKYPAPYFWAAFVLAGE